MDPHNKPLHDLFAKIKSEISDSENKQHSVSSAEEKASQIVTADSNSNPPSFIATERSQMQQMTSGSLKSNDHASKLETTGVEDQQISGIIQKSKLRFISKAMKEREIVKKLELLESGAKEMKQGMDILNRPDRDVSGEQHHKNDVGGEEGDTQTTTAEYEEISRSSWFLYNGISFGLLMTIVLIFTIATTALIASYMLDSQQSK